MSTQSPAKPSTRRTKVRVTAPLIAPTRAAVSAGVKFAPDGDDHPVQLDVLVLDEQGHAVMIPIRLTGPLAIAIGVQLGRNGRLCADLPRPRR